MGAAKLGAATARRNAVKVVTRTASTLARNIATGGPTAGLAKLVAKPFRNTEKVLAGQAENATAKLRRNEGDAGLEKLVKSNESLRNLDEEGIILEATRRAEEGYKNSPLLAKLSTGLQDATQYNALQRKELLKPIRQLDKSIQEQTNAINRAVNFANYNSPLSESNNGLFFTPLDTNDVKILRQDTVEGGRLLRKLVEASRDESVDPLYVKKALNDARRRVNKIRTGAEYTAEDIDIGIKQIHEMLGKNLTPEEYILLMEDRQFADLSATAKVLEDLSDNPVYEGALNETLRDMNKRMNKIFRADAFKESLKEYMRV